MTECRCLCSPCKHEDGHCGGEVCPYEPAGAEVLCRWCDAPIEDCLSDPCEESVEWYAAEYG